MAEMRLNLTGEHPSCLARNALRVFRGDPEAIDRTCIKSVRADAVDVYCPQIALGACGVTMELDAPGYLPSSYELTAEETMRLMERCPWLEEWITKEEVI